MTTNSTFENEEIVDQTPNHNYILIVDDVPLNLQMLGGLLQSKGYEVAPASSGAIALEMAQTQTPDLILLDIQMPEMDGFKVCKLLKENPVTKDIPVIFLTAFVETEDIVRGFELGAVDYISKPFNSSELIARVNTHLSLKQATDIINNKNKELTLANENLEELNTELKNANTMKNRMLSMVAHDLKNPLGGVQGLVSFLLSDDRLTKYSDIIESLELMQISSTSMLDLVKEILDSAALEIGRIQLNKDVVSIEDLVKAAVWQNKPNADTKHQELRLTSLDTADNYFMTQADSKRLSQVFDNLISNAIKYSPFSKLINVTIESFEKYLLVSVADQGPGLTDDDKEKMFGYFQRLSAQPTGGESSNGIGLSIVKQIVELHEGKVWVESEFGHGATFYVKLPVVDLGLD
jgi:two-component system sensor histidine kinase/response regulator